MLSDLLSAGRITADFLRLRLLGITLGAALIGTVTLRPSPSWRMMAVLLVAFFFHIASYVLNDVADIEVDRENPHRARSPLVASKVRLSTAVLVGVGAIIAAFAVDLAAVGRFGLRTVTLAVAFAGLVGYDFAGKRVRLAPVTDSLQGLGWGALVCYGALALGSPSAVTLLIAVYVVIAITLINGVHGALRDVASDLESRASTTALLLGARPGSASGPVVPRSLRVYAWAFQGALAVVVLAGIDAGTPSGAGGWVAAIMAAAFILVSCFFLQRMLHPGDPLHRRLMGGAHIIAVFGAGASIASTGSGPVPALCVLAIMVLPLVPAPRTRPSSSMIPETRQWISTDGFPGSGS
ncbi:MAG TPA: UbiA family prenyltransferase [Streptosporangiaceae bacterium]|nr:UbiA family prenyltransferase [Streptosporangiaceae bacterium]